MRVLLKILFLWSCLLSSNVLAAEVYVIQAAVNDEKFIINDEVFEARTYCLGWDEGDRVIFLEGSPMGVCVSAELYNLDRKEKCSMWCE